MESTRLLLCRLKFQHNPWVKWSTSLKWCQKCSKCNPLASRVPCPEDEQKQSWCWNWDLSQWGKWKMEVLGGTQPKEGLVTTSSPQHNHLSTISFLSTISSQWSHKSFSSTNSNDQTNQIMALKGNEVVWIMAPVGRGHSWITVLASKFSAGLWF